MPGNRGLGDRIDRAPVGARIIFGDPDDQPGDDQSGHPTAIEGPGGEGDVPDRDGSAHVAKDQPHDRNEGDKREDAGGDDALVERAHDVARGAELDEIGAGDRSQNAHPANGEGQHHADQSQIDRQDNRGQNHCGNDGHDIGLEQVRRHAGAVADIVADIVGDCCGVARIVLGDARFDLAHHVATHVGALGKDAAAQSGENGDQRGPEAQGDKSVDDGPVGRIKPHGQKNEEIDGDAQQAQTGNQQSGHGTRFERQIEPAGQRGGRRLGDTHIGAHRDVHANEPGSAREHGPDQKADRRIDAEQQPGNDKDDDADNGNGCVLALEIGGGAFADRSGNLLHAGTAGIGGQKRTRCHDAIDDRQDATGNNQP